MHGVQPWRTVCDHSVLQTNCFMVESLPLVGFTVSEDILSTKACKLSATGDAVQNSSDMCR